MAKIIFNQNIDLSGFNLGDNNIKYPVNQTNPSLVEAATQHSTVYAFVNDTLCNNGVLYGRYKSQALSRDKFVIYKQSLHDNAKTYMATIEGITDGFYDYNLNNSDAYKYIVETSSVVDEGTTAPSVSLETDYYIRPHWSYWSICDIEKNYDVSEGDAQEVYTPSNTVFIMKNNINSGAISDNLNVIKYNTLGQFGKIITNRQKYDSGNISCLISDFVGYQDMRCNANIVTIHNVRNAEQVKAYFANLSNSYSDASERFAKTYFIFPDYSNDYYEYDINNVEVVYILQTQEPSQWDTMFGAYYTWDADCKEYIPISPSYQRLEGQPDDWNERYAEYYVASIGEGEIGDMIDDFTNLTYTLNTSAVFDTTTQYYEAVVPQWNTNEQYYMRAAACCGSKVKTDNIIMNTPETLQAWRNCLSNGKLKLLKAPNGQSWIVNISDPTQLNTQWTAKGYPNTIDFNWQEVLDKDKITIIKW